MCTRLARIWQPGDPQTRVYLPNFWVRFIQSASCGYQQLPPNAGLFEVDPRMSRLDIIQYLRKIYNFPVRDVRIRNVMGTITYDNPASVRYRRALWKEPDRKLAYVFCRKDFLINGGFKFTQDDYLEKQMEERLIASKEQTAAQENNQKFVNRDRPNVGRTLP